MLAKSIKIALPHYGQQLNTGVSQSFHQNTKE